MNQPYKAEFPDSVTTAMWMLRSIIDSMQSECEVFTRQWTSMSYEYRGNPSDSGHTQRHVKFAFVFRDDLLGQRTVCASGTVYRNGGGKWYRGEFSVALSGAALPKDYECKLVSGGQYEVREGTLKAS